MTYRYPRPPTVSRDIEDSASFSEFLENIDINKDNFFELPGNEEMGALDWEAYREKLLRFFEDYDSDVSAAVQAWKQLQNSDHAFDQVFIRFNFE